MNQRQMTNKWKLMKFRQLNESMETVEDSKIFICRSSRTILLCLSFHNFRFDAVTSMFHFHVQALKTRQQQKRTKKANMKT